MLALAFASRNRKSMKNLNQDSQFPGQNLNPGPHEYKADMPLIIVFS
jgi:hypothetical protein